ncbi:DUF3990 domain-containing protein [Adlercreutzia equolifaciens]|uniref:DUF3990 domain-containing protein n=1 Tax=Adlercreutzia equolifaciens TaxID=446660 RepID=UPI003A4E22CC
MLIYHGSPRVVQRPEYRLGNPRNDYGRGFYCTEQLDMAKEWACKRNTDGFANAYQLRVDGCPVLSAVPRSGHQGARCLSQRRSPCKNLSRRSFRRGSYA